MANKRKNGFRTYGAYTFREKDPVIYQLQEMAAGTKLSKITRDGGPSTTCMRSWFQGETKRPQNCTIEAAGRALGFERTWRKIVRRGANG
jgi:hypothetical protein